MLDPLKLAEKLEADLNNIDVPEDAINKFWSSICEYVENEGEVLYGWSAVNSAGSPDTEVEFTAKIKTGGTLTPSGLNKCEDALKTMSTDMNTNISTWTVIPKEGFTLSSLENPLLKLISTSLTLKPSGANERENALLSIATDIITGITASKAPELMGNHGAFIGTATPIKIF